MERKEIKEKTLRIPLGVYEKLEEIAKRRGYSVNELILFMIDYSLGDFDFEDIDGE